MCAAGRVVAALLLLLAPWERSLRAAEALQQSSTAFHRARRDRFLVALVSSTRQPNEDSTSAGRCGSDHDGPKAALKNMQRTSKEVSDEAGAPSSSKQDACVPCSGMDDSFLLTPEQIGAQLAALPSVPAQWQLVEASGAAPSTPQSPSVPGYDHVPLYLCRTFVAKDFRAALEAMRRMGEIAERANHHPDFHLTQYRTVSVVLYTHKLMGVTEQDMNLARLFNEEVAGEYSPKWLRDNGGM